MRVGFLFLLFVTLFTSVFAGGMYGSDHWQYSTKLTEGNFDTVVKEAIDNGQTLFVRWIASEG